MTTRSKIFAAALSLVMASGAVGGAFAKPIVHATKTAAVAAPVTTVKVQKTAAASRHRLQVTHRVTKHKSVAHRVWARAKVAHRMGRSHLVRSHVVTTKIAERPLLNARSIKATSVKSHIAKGPIFKKQYVGKHIAKARLGGLQKHAMLRTTKTSVVR